MHGHLRYSSSSTGMVKHASFHSQTKTKAASSRAPAPLLVLFTVSTVLLQPSSANPVPVDDTLRVSELSFSAKLENPCALTNASRLHRSGSSRQSDHDRMDTRRTVVNELKAKAVLLRDSAETVLRTKILQECSSFVLPSVAIIPSGEDLANSEPLEVLRQFYTSLLNHTAHVYFISDQQQRHSEDQSCYSETLSRSSKSLAANMRELMCVLRLSTVALQDQPDHDNAYFDDPTSQILNEQFIDQPVCSRRVSRDCQTVTSTVTLLRELTSYLNATLLATESES